MKEKAVIRKLFIFIVLLHFQYKETLSRRTRRNIEAYNRMYKEND